MPFRSIVGHRRVIALLSRAVARDALPPSLIFAGPEGVGKRRVALALAQVLNCIDRKSDSPKVWESERRDGDLRTSGPSDLRTFVDACGKCASCRRIEKGIHPDVLWVDEKGVHPEVVDVEVKDTSTIIPVPVIRELSKLASFRPYEARRRVIVFDPADAMERPSQSALLKVLEEPPSATMFMLVTGRPDALYATIRSRCPQIRFGALSVAEISELLVRDHEMTEGEARSAAIVAGGSVARALDAAAEESSDARSQALSLLQEAAAVGEPSASGGGPAVDQGEARRRMLEAMKGAFGMDKRGTVAPAVEREQVTLSLRALLSLLRDVTMIGSKGPAAALANADLQADLERVAPSFGRERVMRAFEAVDRALGALNSNANPKIVVDWLAFQI